MENFESLLAEHRGAVERFVKFRIANRADAEDVLQEVLITAYRKFGQLSDTANFKPWLIAIARSRCTDYYRARAADREIPLAAVGELPREWSLRGRSAASPVHDTLAKLKPAERQILTLFYLEEMPLAEIARALSIPEGTVKSRLHKARGEFRRLYPYAAERTEENPMKTRTKLPERLPEYTITPSEKPPYTVKWEELMGWCIVPRLGEKVSWGLYDMPARTRTEYTDMEVIGRAEVHGIEGVEIVAVQHDAENYYRTGSVAEMERRFVAQLTDTHCRYLAESHVENGVRKCYTFLDGDAFLNNWGFGKDNCGSETNLSPKGILVRAGSVIRGGERGQNLDVVGRYTVTIGEKTYDTVCVMDVDCFSDAVASEQYLDENGRTVLWRRFNRDDWAFVRYQKTWSEMLPENERLTIGGMTYVHWYDCITDYIL